MVEESSYLSYKVDASRRWGNRADTWERDIEDKSHYVNIENGYQRFLVFMHLCIGDGQIGKVLDVGCGTGAVSRSLLKRVGSVYGVDIAPRMIDCARGISEEVQYEVGDALELPYQERCFALVVSRGILISHLPGGCAEDLIREYARVLKPHGKLVFDFLQNVDKNEVGTRRKKPIFSCEKIHTLLTTTGFRPLRFEDGGTKRVNSVFAGLA